MALRSVQAFRCQSDERARCGSVPAVDSDTPWCDREPHEDDLQPGSVLPADGWGVSGAAIDLSDGALRSLAEKAGALLLQGGRRVATAESCTGGWVAKCLTDIPGSSQWFERGYVTYSNLAKEQSIGVAASVIETFGAVSRATVQQMAAGALHESGADLAVAITGIAGPDGGTPEKPVGLVWFALAQRAAPPVVQQQHFAGDREAIRRAAVAMALGLVIAAAGTQGSV
jgi:nicotinamide-nucleotide amidase